MNNLYMSFHMPLVRKHFITELTWNGLLFINTIATLDVFTQILHFSLADGAFLQLEGMGLFMR